MKQKSEARYLEKWMHKGRAFAKQPPTASSTPYNLDHTDDMSSAMEQINIKVPKGTKARLRRLGMRAGGLSMRRMFKRMLDEFEERHPDKDKG